MALVVSTPLILKLISILILTLIIVLVFILSELVLVIAVLIGLEGHILFEACAIILSALIEVIAVSIVKSIIESSSIRKSSPITGSSIIGAVSAEIASVVIVVPILEVFPAIFTTIVLLLLIEALIYFDGLWLVVLAGHLALLSVLLIVIIVVVLSESSPEYGDCYLSFRGG